jgi:hypothetical protein
MFGKQAFVQREKSLRYFCSDGNAECSVGKFWLIFLSIVEIVTEVFVWQLQFIPRFSLYEYVSRVP